jgi:hypothetical protein
MNRWSSLACALVLLSGCAVQSSPSSDEAPATKVEELKAGKPYLALGDSVAFGYNAVDAVKDPTNLRAFVGYPELTTWAGFLSPRPVSNASCEGETSGSFIDVTAPDNGCHAWRAAGDAMHVTYASASESQLTFALKFLATHPDTATVSIGIGANDLLVIRNACAASFNPATDPNYVSDVTNCELSQVPAAIGKAAQNIGTIAGAIRASGYKGQLVLVTYYAENYSNPSDPTLLSIAGLDQAMVKVAQAYPQLDLSIARGFSSFAEVATLVGGGDACKAGLLYKLPDGTCDEHPSREGQALLAVAVASAVPASSIDLSASTPQY